MTGTLQALLGALQADLDRDVQWYLAREREKDRLKYLARTHKGDHDNDGAKTQERVLVQAGSPQPDRAQRSPW